MKEEFTQFHPYDADQILIRTTDQGPWVEDCFWLVIRGEQIWEVPNSASLIMFEWMKDCDRIDWEQSIMASCSVENAIFPLWRKDGPPVLSEKVREDLKTRLDAFLASHFEFDRADRDQVSLRVIALYTEPHRKYHTLKHIAHCLWELDRCAISHEAKEHIELAIWFHDVIYQTKSKTNEDDSAVFMTEQIGQAKTKLDLDKVRSMILASKHLSGGSTGDPVTDLFLDIDLAILGQPQPNYSVYQRNVREEYADIKTWRFLIGRKRVLKHFDKSEIFRTEAFKQKYEQAAHQNLKEELSQTKYAWIFWE